MTFKELLPDAQYEGIVFYLSEQGFSSPLDMTDFDYDDLYFVPGVSDDAIEQCKVIFRQYMESASQDDNTPQNVAVDDNYRDVSTAECNEEIPPNSDDLPSAFAELTTLIAAASNTVNTRERLTELQREFLEEAEYYNRYDFELFSFLCKEIDKLCFGSNEEGCSNGTYSPEECKRNALRFGQENCLCGNQRVHPCQASHIHQRNRRFRFLTKPFPRLANEISLAYSQGHRDGHFKKLAACSALRENE